MAAVRQGGGTVDNEAALAPLVTSQEQAVQLAAGMHRSRIAAPGASLCVPLFAASSVTGASLDLLHSFLNALEPAGSGGSCAAAGALEGMQGWLQLSPAAAASGGAQLLPPAAHFQIDDSFEVADVGSGKPLAARCMTL